MNNVHNRLNEEGKKLTGFNVQEELIPLVDKGYLVDFDNKFEIIDLMVTPHFEDMIFIDTQQAGQELFDVYPNWILVNGSKQVAKKGGDINGMYYGKDQMFELYSKKIGNDKVKHEAIMSATQRAKDQDLIGIALRNYIHDELWDAYMELEDKGDKYKSI